MRMKSFIITMLYVALPALLFSPVAAAPYPPEIALYFPQPAFFGHRNGNFQPTRVSSIPTPVLMATGEVVTGGAAVCNITNDDGVGAGSDKYIMYSGSGSSQDGWPRRSQWVSFVDMFNNNKGIMFSACSQYGVENDSGPEVGAIYDAVQQVAVETCLDHRFILAEIIQESGGCVRVPTSNYGVRNPGLMQCHDGDATCNSDITHQVQSPCPTSVITQMVRDGSAGTSSGDGLAALVNQAESTDHVTGSKAFYVAARLYNSGSVDSSGDLGKGIATHCYSSDIANRLMGWVTAPHGCTLDG